MQIVAKKKIFIDSSIKLIFKISSFVMFSTVNILMVFEICT